MFTYIALHGKWKTVDRVTFWEDKIVYAGKNKELAFNNKESNQVQIWNDGIYEQCYGLVNNEWIKY